MGRNRFDILFFSCTSHNMHGTCDV